MFFQSDKLYNMFFLMVSSPNTKESTQHIGVQIFLTWLHVLLTFRVFWTIQGGLGPGAESPA